MRNIIAAGLLLACFSVAQAQVITPGIGGVAVTGQSGTGLYIPYGGGGVTVGSPGLGSYNLNGGVYTSPFSWNQFNDPTAYNFNTGGFNYNSGVYNTGWNNGWNTNGWNSGLTTAGYYGSPYSNGNVILNSGYTYPSNTVYYSNGTGRGWTTPVVYSNGNGRGRGNGRWR